jgi:YHS domain-containing protein
MRFGFHAGVVLSAMLTLALAPAVRAHGGQEDGENESPEAKAEAAKHKGAPKSFKSKPAVGTWATCPVSGETFQIGADTKFAEHNGRTYAFCCPGCISDFSENPAKYSTKGKTKA